MSKSTLVHYVEFFYPGVIVTDTSAKRIKDRNSKFKIPKECFGYRFFDKIEVKEGNETLEGGGKNYSDNIYFGRLMSLEDVKRKLPKETSLIFNMKVGGYHKVVRTKFGQYIPVEPKDKVISRK